MKARKETLKIPAFSLSNPSRQNYAIKNLYDEQVVIGAHNISLPHRDDHYMMVLIQAGKLKVTIDLESFEINNQSLLMIFPDQVHHLIPQEKLAGWAISFEGHLISKELKDALEKNWRNRAPVYPGVSPAWLEQVALLLSCLFQLNDRPLVTMQSIASGLLTAALSIIIGHVEPEISMDKNKNKRPATIKNQFLTLLYQHYKLWKKPSIYADKLNISTSHLNDTVKNITGKSATEAIQGHCILEARRLLTYTDLKVKEIAYEIGYENLSHFIKIFKNVTGITPALYRQSLK